MLSHKFIFIMLFLDHVKLNVIISYDLLIYFYVFVNKLFLLIIKVFIFILLVFKYIIKGIEIFCVLEIIRL